MAYITPGVIQPYWGYNLFTPALPNFYWDVKSAEQRIKHICYELHKIAEYSNYLGENINLDHEMIEELQSDFEQFKDSGFIDYYETLIKEWMDNHVAELFEMLAKMVFFGLTDDGYFCAYVPDSWSDIQFDTGATYGRFDYGRLILRYDVDGSGVIDNTGTYSDEDLSDIKSRIDFMERTLYTRLGIEVQNGD